MDVLIGGFPCQDVSTVGKGAGLAPGTRSGLWSHMAAAIDALQPELVVIENVRGLLSAPAIRPTLEGATPMHATPTMQPTSVQPPFATWNSTRGCWETSQRDLFGAHGAVLGDLVDLRRSARWIGLPASLAGAPHHRFRLPRGRCSGRLWPRTPHAAARPWSRYRRGGARSP